jgi:hypothetical protein
MLAARVVDWPLVCSRERQTLEIRYEMKNHEQWMAVCEQASKEQDSRKLSLLVAEILRLTDEKQRRVDRVAQEEKPK